MKNVTGTGRSMAERDDRERPDAGPDRERVRGVADDADEFDADEDDELDEDEDEEGSF
jgi:hypothetical protein